jgi:hypothetical protein
MLLALQWSEVKVAKTLADAIDQLKGDPPRPVRAQVQGLTVEVRVVPQAPAESSAAELFERVGPWAGETTDEILAILADARRKGSRRQVSEL